jgi:signal transduction histidine kinase
MTRLDEEEQQEALQFIDSECTRMERLSQKLMTLISLRQEGALELTACRVSDLFAQVEASCARQLQERGLTLKIENHMDTVQGEPDLLVSLLLNLIDNAGKASRSGGTIFLSAEHDCFTVRDFGHGMKREELDKITQPFYMGDKSRSRRAGGVGLGLALCAEIAALHGAELSFDSAPGQETTAKLQFAYHPMRTC